LIASLCSNPAATQLAFGCKQQAENQATNLLVFC
jgi:hypothetical protein